MGTTVRSPSGQALVELTLIFMLLVGLVFGVVEIGSLISTYLTLTHTTREGANLTSRGTAVNTALDAIIDAAAPTMTAANQAQWRVIYSKITQNPGNPCPPKPCVYRVESHTIRGNFAQNSRLTATGAVNENLTISGLQDVDPGQTFHAIEVFYDYTPNVITFIGDLFDKTIYERTIFTNVSN